MIVRCAICDAPTEDDHPLHGEDCTWTELECCRCDENACAEHCPFCEKEKVA